MTHCEDALSGVLVNDRVECVTNTGAKYFGSFTTEFLPPTFDHRGEARVARRLHLLDWNVFVGMAVVFDESVDDYGGHRKRGGDGHCSFDRSELGRNQNRVVALVAQPVGESLRLSVAPFSEVRVGRLTVGFVSLYSYGFGVADNY